MSTFKDKYDTAMDNLNINNYTDEVWVSKTVDNLIGTLANNNMIIDQVLRQSHDIISHQGMGLRIEENTSDNEDDDDKYYNSNETELKSVSNNLCKNNKSVCKEELSTYGGMRMLALIPQIFTFHILIVIIFVIILIVVGSIWKIIEAIKFIQIMMLSDEEKEKRYQEKKKEVDIDEKDKYTWVSIFKYIVETIFWANCGLGPSNMFTTVSRIYMAGFLVWGLTHAIIYGLNQALPRAPIVVSEFAPNQANPTTPPGILYFIRFPIFSKDFFSWIKDPWIVTPMAARDDGKICTNGFEPTSDGDVQKREKVEYDYAKENLDWCITGGTCPFGGTSVEDKEKYDEYNKKEKIKYVDVGEITAPFENRCQPMKGIDDKFKEDATKFADDTVKKIGSIF